jgi:aminoglycoside N3'-acetyltransferase
MGEKKSSVRTYDACSSPKIHGDHMCLLMEKGMSTEIRKRTTHPAYSCANCGARANERGDLCNPRELGPA